MSKSARTILQDTSSSPDDSTSERVVTCQTQMHGQSLTWQVRTSWLQRLTGLEAPDWLHLIESDKAQRVKCGRGREVWRVKLGEDIVYAKVAGPTHWLDTLKTFLVGTSAKREWRAIRKALAHGVSVVEPLAVGVERGGGKHSVLITHAFERGTDLGKCWSDLQSLRRGTSEYSSTVEVRVLIDTLAGFIADSHQKGFVHRDLHPANILVRKVHDCGYEFRFVDLLGSCVCRSAVERSAAIRSLSQLHQFFGRVSSKTHRLRFLRAYLSYIGLFGQGGAAKHLRREWVGSMLTQVAHDAQSLARQRDRRLHRSGKYFTQLRRRGGWGGVVTLALERRHVFSEPAVEDRNEKEWSTLLSEVLPKLASCKGGEGSLEFEGLQWRYQRAASLLERWRWTWLGSPAKRAFLDSQRKRHRGHNAPLILGYFQRAQLGLVDLSVSVHPNELVDDDGI